MTTWSYCEIKTLRNCQNWLCDVWLSVRLLVENCSNDNEINEARKKRLEQAQKGTQDFTIVYIIIHISY